MINCELFSQRSLFLDGSLIRSEGWPSARELSSTRTSQLMVSTVQLGANTTAGKLQGQIINKLIKKGRDTLGAPKHKKVTVFIDDLNMPIPEQYGAQPPLEFIRQFLEMGGFYDTQTLSWKIVRDVVLVAACAPPGGGRNYLSPRLLKHFSVFFLPHPSVQSLQHIFQVQLGSFLQSNNFLAEIQKCRDLLSSSSIAIYVKMSGCMLPTPAKCHYTFNLRDLFKVLQGLLQANETVIVTKESAALLLAHEAARVFHDRLVECKDRETFYQLLSDELLNYFKDFIYEDLNGFLNSGDIPDLFDKEELDGIIMELQASTPELTQSNSTQNRFFTGLLKLREAGASVETMQRELTALGPQIEQKTQEIETLIAKAKKDSIVVKQVRAIVAEEEEIMAAETRIVQDYAENAVQELNDVLPALEEAVSALDALDKSDISEVKVYTHPPFLVLTVMNAVCVLLQKKPDWTTAKLLLGDQGFLKKLVSLDKDSIPEKAFQKLKKYSKIPDFNPQKVGMVSSACRSLCQWVLALEHYHDVNKMVTPKQKRVAEAQEALGLAQDRLKHKQKSLAVVEEHLQLIQKQYNESVAEKDVLACRKELTTERLKRASVLISALVEEKFRWKESVDKLDLTMGKIIGDTLISSAFIVYCGVFTSEYREKLVGEWMECCAVFKIPLSENYSIIRAMTSENEVRQWQNEGLPLDPYSTENAVLVKNGRHWPLFIDHDGQAYKWICQMEGDKLRKAQASNLSYLKKMENAIRLGEAFLLHDVSEELDPSLKSVLRKEIFRRSGQDFIKIGDSEIEYNQNFRLYLTSQATNPHFLPAVCIMVTMINFTVTFKGLQDQLLSSVVTHEQPQLELQHCQLLESITTDVWTLHELEEKSLSLLHKTQGHLLDDEELIDTLQKSKIKSKDVIKRIEDSGRTKATIEAARGIYLPIAKRGAILYFVVADLIRLNYMYQFSLQWFHQVYVEAMKAAHAPQTMIVSSALFTEHQLCFSFMLSVNIMRNNDSRSGGPSQDTLGSLPSTEWEFFLHSRKLIDIKENSQASDKDKDPIYRIPGQLTESTWKECQYLSTHMEPFSLLCESLLTNTQQWEDFQNCLNPYEFLKGSYIPAAPPQQGRNWQNRNNYSNCSVISILHKPYEYSDILSKSAGREERLSSPVLFKWEELSSFQKLLLIKVLRTECLISAIQEFIKMGPTFLKSGRLNLRETLEESNARNPLIFILSPGTDPVGQLERLALETRGSTLHLDIISLGRGQGAKAEELINNARRLKGKWVFLQNCHLAASFMPKLCTIVETLAHPSSTTDPQFRLWLSSRPDESFPIPILQKGFKMAVEPPRGLKGKLSQTFDSSGTGVITEKIFEINDRGKSWRKILFSLCFFNAIVNERKKYGALGWNIPYEFTSSDLEVTVQMLTLLTDGQNEIPWRAVHYLTGEVVYGGRVTDFWDRRCLLSILDNFCNLAILQDNYSFCSDKVYGSLPDGASLQDYRDYVESLPDTDSPEIFGMHRNAELVNLQSQANMFMDTVICMQSSISVHYTGHR
ncbi:hypothetical protein GDO86_009129 [Hymenochirus boettgeri]|uniref:Uncharacterized protein n=1 Tax=Hymenochirus boettgeri TaxID=247094 RepID=A0A8T2JHQ7_9PIPI|nr:hypothetical protein GDO86_009129 [Hymenochirus boettgeri]